MRYHRDDSKVKFVEPRQKGDISGAGVPLPDDLCEIATKIAGRTMTVTVAMKQFKAKIPKGWKLTKHNIQSSNHDNWNGMILLKTKSNKGIIHCWRVICWENLKG